MVAETKLTEVWPMIATGASILATIIWTLALFIMSDFRTTLKKHGSDIEDIKDRLSICRRECDDEHVSKDDYLREAGYNRRFQERQISDMAEIKTLVKTMPELTGQIVRAVMAEMKRGEQ
jgi:hypothetical protein